MKMTGRILLLITALTFSFFGESCKDKKKADTTQNTNTNTNAPVVVNSDADLRTSVEAVVKAYDGVQAEVKDGIITLRGTVKQDDLQKLIQRVQELRPKKVENQLVIK